MLKGPAGDRVAALVKDEDRHAVETELAGQLAEAVDIFLHRIADKDERIDPLLFGFGKRMRQHALDLRLTADAGHRAHDPMQIGCIAHPAARFAFVEAAVIDELDVEPAERGGRLEHLALDAAGAIPGRLAARRRVEREDQSTPPARWRRRGTPQLAQESIDLGRSGLCRELALFIHHVSPAKAVRCRSVTLTTLRPGRKPGTLLAKRRPIIYNSAIAVSLMPGRVALKTSLSSLIAPIASLLGF